MATARSHQSPKHHRTTEKVAAKRQKDRVIGHVFVWNTLLLVATIGIFILQGFHVGGFDLDKEILRYLAIVAVGELGTTVWFVFREVFR